MNAKKELWDALAEEIRRLERAKDAIDVADDALLERVIQVFGNPLASAKWLISPCSGLGGRTPLECSAEKKGREEVERILGRLADGVPQ